ncbi:MAG: hypothetical protein KKI08_05280 [Armatimonadetes bacterium]|nr:hypothetical protein [Armatimonadota bacterium]
MATTGRMTIAFTAETRRLIEDLLPAGQRTDFVDRVVKDALRRLAREKLEEEMAECAREMYDEIMALQEDFLPLEEEVHRQV